MNDYIRKWVESIKTCTTDEEIAASVDKIYSEGYEDCANNNNVQL